MNPYPAHYRFLLRIIIAVYLLLFISGLLSSGYLLLRVIAEKPILLIGLLKYLLLCILFIILGINAVKAFSLETKAVGKLSESTKNFKWLFFIAIIIVLFAKSGLFDSTAQKPLQVSWIQTGILIALALFCFRSDQLLQQQKPAAEEDKEINTGT